MATVTDDRTAVPRTTSDLAKRGLLATVIAVAANLLVTLGATLAAVAPGFDPLTYPQVAVVTTIGVVGATVAYAALDRLVANADRAFLALAVVVLVVSFVPTLTFAPALPGATTAGIAVLSAMHVVAAAVAVALLTDLRERN